MALPLWGQLEKAQDDSTTIEEYIATAIANHNSDSEAHNGSGESLEEHKIESVIDHPAGSLVADKQTMTEISVSTIFESIDGWSTGGEVDNSDIPGLQLYVEDGFVDDSYISTNPQSPKNFRDSDFDMLFQMQANFDFAGETFDGNFGFFASNAIDAVGFGFIVDGGELYGYIKDSGGNDITSEVSVDLSLDHIYRAFFDATESKVYFFLDGVQVGVLDLPSSGWSDDSGPRIWIGRGSESDGNLFVGILNFSRGI